jgi:hypothetical protein
MCDSGGRCKSDDLREFRRLLRPGHSRTHCDCDNESNNPRQFSILDPSAKLRTGFRFPIVGGRMPESNQDRLTYSLVPQSKIGNRKSKIIL